MLNIVKAERNFVGLCENLSTVYLRALHAFVINIDLLLGVENLELCNGTKSCEITRWNTSLFVLHCSDGNET